MHTIPLSRPCLGEEEVTSVRETILSGWVAQGPRVERFERGFEQYCNAAHAVAVANCTAGLHLALLAVGTRPGDVVITVSASFIASANSIRHCGAEPVFVDVDPVTYNIDASSLRRVLENDFDCHDGQYWYRHTERFGNHSPLKTITGARGRLAAIMVVHQFGMPADIAALKEITGHYRVPLVEDAACAAGSGIRIGENFEKIGKPHGRIAVFSFHARKVITTGEGGMITTGDSQAAEWLRGIRQHGTTASALSRHRSTTLIGEQFRDTGFNYRMSDIQAAVGVIQLERLDRIVEERRKLAAMYSEQLADLPLVLPFEPPYASTNWQSYMVVLDDQQRRDAAISMLRETGIYCKEGIMCAHHQEPYADGEWSLPESDRLNSCGLILPLFVGMSGIDVARVSRQLGRQLG